METRSLLSSLVTASLFTLGAGCGLPVPPLPSPIAGGNSAVVSASAPRTGSVTTVRDASGNQIEQVRAPADVTAIEVVRAESTLLPATPPGLNAGCVEQPVTGTPGCLPKAELIAGARRSCEGDTSLSRVMLTDSCDGGYLGASALCCPGPAIDKPRVCIAYTVSNHDLCLTQNQFLAHAKNVCHQAGLHFAEPSFAAADCPTGLVAQMSFGCCDTENQP